MSSSLCPTAATGETSAMETSLSFPAPHLLNSGWKGRAASRADCPSLLRLLLWAGRHHTLLMSCSLSALQLIWKELRGGQRHGNSGSGQRDCMEG